MDRDDTSLPTFARHRDEARAEVQLADVERHELAHAKPRGVEELEHRAIADAERVVTVGRFEQREDFVSAQDLGETTRELRTVEEVRRIARRELLAEQELMELPQTAQILRLRTGREPAPGELDDERRRREVGRFEQGHPLALEEPEVAREVLRVRADRVRRRAPLDPQMVEEGIDVQRV